MINNSVEKNKKAIRVNEKTTIYLDPNIKKSVRYYAVRDDKSLSEIINDKLYDYLEEQDDAAVYSQSKAEHEADSRTYSLAEVTKELGIDLDEIRRTAISKS